MKSELRYEVNIDTENLQLKAGRLGEIIEEILREAFQGEHPLFKGKVIIQSVRLTGSGGRQEG